MFLTIPTLMTWARIFAIPLIVAVFYMGLQPSTQNLVATVLFVVFAVFFEKRVAQHKKQSDAQKEHQVEEHAVAIAL